MIISDMTLDNISESVVDKTDRYRAMIYDLPPGLTDHVKSLCLPGSTTFMFSGSWRLDMDSTYLELKFFRDCYLAWNPKTLFLEPQQPDLYFYTLKKLQQSNLIILHSDYWCGHREFDEIVTDLDHLKSFASCVICTVPIRHTNFNKLTTSVDDLCQSYKGVSVFQDSLVMIR